MGHSRKIPRVLLWARKSALKIDIMKPSAIIETIKLKLFIRNERKMRNTKKSIEI